MGLLDGFDLAYLNALDQEYGVAEVAKSRFVEVADGNYQAYIEAFLLEESKRNVGEPILKMKFTIISGPYHACSVTKIIPINPDSMARLKTDLTTLGFRYEGIMSLQDEARLREMLDLIVDIRVTHKTSEKTGKTYMNVWVNRVVGEQQTGGREADDLGYDPGYAPPAWGG